MGLLSLYIFGPIGVLALVILGFFCYQKSKQKARENQQVAKLLSYGNGVDDPPVSNTAC